MSEFYQEQHPLLSEDYFEDHYSPQYQRRFRPMAFRTRSRSNVKGAASIIRRWPDYLSTAVIYWWMGFGMIAIITLVIYNGVMAFAFLPSATRIIPRIQDEPILNNIPSNLPKVYMHKFINSVEDEDTTELLPDIKELSEKYPNYEYHFVLMVNDTYDDHLSAEEYNEIALNSLLSKPKLQVYKKIEGIVIEKLSLTKFMNESPLKKYWRNIPQNYIEFMVRAISIWDKGGLAFNPNLILSHSHNYIYIKQIHSILKTYTETKNKSDYIVPKVEKTETVVYEGEKTDNIESEIEKISNQKKTGKPKVHLNNIAEIIHAMEKNNNMGSSNEHNLTAAEDREILSSIEFIEKNKIEKNNITVNGPISIRSAKNYTEPIGDNQERYQELLKITESQINRIQSNISMAVNNSSNVPLFLNILNKRGLSGNNTKKKYDYEPFNVGLVRKRKGVINTEHPKDDWIKKMIQKNDTQKYKPMIISTSPSNHYAEFLEKPDDTFMYEHDDQLIIDIKGNIIATKTACHAFIGTIFSNVIHYSQNVSVSDFIILELSYFCKGVLSSCDSVKILF